MPRAVLAEAISDELDRQARQGAQRVDVTALVEVIESLLQAHAAPPADEGRRPEELNATNDD
ncbi:hypothetical protein [Devosia sp. LC5]|uniref:hypothetical protein n=1 Tax=Devosia sp. LC5 TaxID=1502724 RepID=UPI0005521148|nr:hypothetical protein [Devosia sp. LC5]